MEDSLPALVPRPDLMESSIPDQPWALGGREFIFSCEPGVGLCRRSRLLYLGSPPGWLVHVPVRYMILRAAHMLELCVRGEGMC